MREAKQLWTAILLLFSWGVAESLAQDELKPLKLQFVDVYGEPIAAVQVDPQSIVFRGNPGLSLAAGPLLTKNDKPLRADAKGALTIEVPDLQLGELAQIKIVAEHDSHAQFDDWLQVNVGGVTTVELARGVQIAVTALTEEGERIVDGLYAISEQKDRMELVDWKSNGKGLLLSRRLRVLDKRIRLVQIVDGEVLRFSEPIDVDNVDGERTLLSDVPMTKALRFAGRLSPDVARPVKNGMVTACVAWPTQEELQEYGPTGHWLAHAPIAEDGTFEFEGLPAGDTIQILASCDGWFTEAAPAGLEIYPGESKLLADGDSILPELFEFTESVSDAELEMVPMRSCRVRCMIEGKPVADAKVIASREQRLYHASWHSRNFRHALGTKDQLIAARTGKQTQGEAFQFSAPTNGAGEAEFPFLPGSPINFRVEGYRFDNNFFWQSADLEEQQTIVELEILPSN